MKKNTIILFIIAVMLSVSLFVGCGNDTSANPTNAPATQKPTAEATIAPTSEATQVPTQEPTNTPDTGNKTDVYVDQIKGKDLNNGSADSPVASLDKAFSLLPEGGNVFIVGTYTFEFEDDTPINNYVVMLPETNGKVVISSADKTKLSTLLIETGTKTTLQPISPIEINNIYIEYDHAAYNGKVGAMNIYTGPELVIGDNVFVDCINDACPGKPFHENCIAIRGGWHTPECKGSIYTGDDIILTIMSGNYAYVNGGNADGNTPVGNSVITIGGTTEIYQRLQVTGSNGGDVTGNVTLNITGGNIGSGGSETDESKLSQYGLILIGHGKNGNNAEISGNVTINITGGTINSIHASRTEFESLTGDLTLTISEGVKYGDVFIDGKYFDLDKTQTLNLPTGADASVFGDIWDEINQ